ncbi:cytochrome P450 [Actinomadura parmotrematis]|uniref:Cytochrome P450 n=1 Tax=Actinomadura parmotrematis TaxID=2864039 RepID=A0ABS7FUB5_9ACTN|nr:cytochrome P450 [Actinomadura parmotrematis]MBW8484003.1 cytochrome P450 [Actinomadura parmotrematis]
MPQRRGALPVSDAEALCSPDAYARGVPYERLDRLRARTPVVWMNGLRGGRGAWAVLRHADVRYALEHPELFAPEFGEMLHGPTAGEERGRPAHDDAPADAEGPAALDLRFDMDPPELVGRVAAGGVDFVTDVVADLPETLRNTLAGGLWALLRNPAAHDLLRGDAALLDAAVEEVLRWWTPVLRVPRTVLRPTSLGGVPLLAGEHVALWLAAADHDAAAFPDPGRFLPERFADGTAPPHLAFGHGVRSCLGERLARVHLRALMAALLNRPGRPVLAGEPIPLRSSARHGFARLPVRWTG